MLIGVDWGTTHLRAHLLEDDGTVLATTRAERGLMKVPPGGFEAALGEAVADLRHSAPDAPVVMSGMVGSREGWVEAPYVPVPADLAAIAARTVRVDAPSVGEVWLIPGVAVGMDGNAWADVMRGEETEVLGAVAASGIADGTFVLPGTHSKWVQVENGTIAGFRTYMTGDVYNAVGWHTILSRTHRGTWDPAAFEAGLDMARELVSPGDLLTRLFTVRAEFLMGRLLDTETLATISGLLVGAELLSGARDARSVTIVGTSELAHNYVRAAVHLEIHPTVAREENAARGHALLAAALRGGPAAPR